MVGIAVVLFLLHHVNNSFCTRLPLEVFDIPQSTQVYSTGSNYIKHKSIYNHHPERRRSRQMLEALQPQTMRVLYQVGESEDDLPTCAPNAVCSKIDLYETPWIERQCRCPEAVFTKDPINVLHHKDHAINENKYQEILEAERPLNRRVTDYDDKRLDNIHLKKLMQKLGAVYQDDILLDDNDLEDSQDISNSFQNRKALEYAIGTHKNYIVSSKSIPDFNKVRHSGHRKDIPYIGGCPSSLGANDGHTIADKTRHYKLCNPVHKLPLCRYFRDYTWTLSTSPEMNVTEQIVHCRCPKNSVTYLTKREPLATGRTGYSYLFACSPQSRLRCQRKEPCKLFTVRKRQEFLDEVNTNPLCQCPKGHRCPKHHTESGVISGKSFIEDNIQTYSGYCMAND